MESIRATSVEELRKPHPDQHAIDAASAALLRATALQVFQGFRDERRGSGALEIGPLPAEERAASPR